MAPTTITGSQQGWQQANAEVYAYNAARGRGAYAQGAGKSSEKGVTPPGLDNVAPSDFAVNASSVINSEGASLSEVLAKNPAAFEAPPGEPIRDAEGGASAKGKSLPWHNANAYVLQQNAKRYGGSKAEGVSYGLQGADRAHYDAVPNHYDETSSGKQSNSCLPPIDDPAFLESLSVCDHPLPKSAPSVALYTSATTAHGTSAAPGEPIAQKGGEAQKGSIPWAEANQYVWNSNAEKGRANKLPAYVYRAWGASGVPGSAVVAA